MTGPTTSISEPGNELLRTMSEASLDRLRPFLELVPMPVRFRLSEAGRVTTWVYFLESGVASVICQAARAWQEIGIIGREGACCHLALLTYDIAPYTTFMQIEGQAFRMRSDVLVNFANQDASLRTVLLNYKHAFGIQVSQTAIANVQCNIPERLARWLLMAQDRIGQPVIIITHEFLAGMLGVGRTGVTLALQELERAGLIRTGRKRVEIIERARLEALTAGYYGFAEKQYRRLMVRPASGPLDAMPKATPSSLVPQVA